MGAASSVMITEELQKPADASDLADDAACRTEVIRLRQIIAAQQTPVPTLLAKSSPLKGAPHIGDCPFAHFCRMAFHIAEKPLNVIFVDSDKKPAWLLEEPFNGSMPCLAPAGFDDGTGAIVESSKVAAVALPPTEADNAALAALGGLLPALCGYCKGDASKNEALATAVDDVLARGEKHLADTGAAFFSGDAPGYADAHTITKLHVLHSVGAHFNKWDLDAERFPKMKSYCERVFAMKAFEDTVYPHEEGVAGWGAERE